MSKPPKPRSHQLCEDTLATMSIANEMVLAMFRHFQVTVKDQRSEIELLTDRVHELEELLTEVKSDWFPTPRETYVDTVVPSETRIVLRIDPRQLDREEARLSSRSPGS